MSEKPFSCVVCCHLIPGRDRKKIFAIGPCDHPVCYYCTTKMRVLCERNECPICRQELSEVIFNGNYRKKFNEFGSKRRFSFNEKFKIYFESKDYQDVFNSLLEEKCKKCKTLVGNVAELNDHLWDSHRLLQCELCVQNLKIFSEERRYYTSRQLEVHYKHGDRDDRSFKGHPFCKLCNQRFFDSEELDRHLRRDHYHCHLCEIDKIVYYKKYEMLKQHFRDKHFLCEEGPCKNEQFTSVFRSAIDLQAHKAQIHCLSKSEAKHARMLSLNLIFNPPQRGPRAGGFNPQVVASLNDEGFNSRGAANSRRGRGDRNDRVGDRNPSTIPPDDEWMAEDLESLGAAGPSQQLIRPEDFPSLGEPGRQSPPIRPESSMTIPATTVRPPETTTNSKESKKPKDKYSAITKGSATLGRKDDEEFPALCVPSSGNRERSYRLPQPSSSTATSFRPPPPPPPPAPANRNKQLSMKAVAKFLA